MDLSNILSLLTPKLAFDIGFLKIENGVLIADYNDGNIDATNPKRITHARLTKPHKISIYIWIIFALLIVSGFIISYILFGIVFLFYYIFIQPYWRKEPYISVQLESGHIYRIFGPIGFIENAFKATKEIIEKNGDVPHFYIDSRKQETNIENNIGPVGDHPQAIYNVIAEFHDPRNQDHQE